MSGSYTAAVVGFVSSSSSAVKPRNLDDDPETCDHSFIDDQASLLS